MAEIDLSNRAIYSFVTTCTIRYADLDPNDHVNNNAVTVYLEDGRVRLRKVRFADLGEDRLAGFAIARVAVDYLRPLRYPGEVEVGTVVIRIGRTSYTLGQAVFSEGACAASAEVVTVRIDPATGRPAPLLPELRARLESLGPSTGSS